MKPLAQNLINRCAISTIFSQSLLKEKQNLNKKYCTRPASSSMPHWLCKLGKLLVCFGLALLEPEVRGSCQVISRISFGSKGVFFLNICLGDRVEHVSSQ